MKSTTITTRSGSKTSEKGSTVSNPDGDIECDAFVLHLIEALNDPQVQAALSKASRPNEERIAQLISSHLEIRFKGMQKQIDDQSKRIAFLEKTVSDLQSKQDDAEQYSRRTSVRIAGIPESDGEDVVALTRDVLKAVDLSTAAINRVHRVGPKLSAADDAANSSPKHRPILCQFLSYGDKATLMGRKKLLRGKMDGVFINEDLTRKRASILYEARRLVKTKKLKGTWSTGGRILVMDNRGLIRRITSTDDLKVF